MRCVVSCCSTSFPWLVFFFGALLWGSVIHKHTGRWMWQGSASVVSWSWEKYSCQSKPLDWQELAVAFYQSPQKKCSCNKHTKSLRVYNWLRLKGQYKLPIHFLFDMFFVYSIMTTTNNATGIRKAMSSAALVKRTLNQLCSLTTHCW